MPTATTITGSPELVGEPFYSLFLLSIIINLRTEQGTKAMTPPLQRLQQGSWADNKEAKRGRKNDSSRRNEGLSE